MESVEKVSPVEKRYEPLPQISPSSQYGPPASALPPNALPKLSPSDGESDDLCCSERETEVIEYRNYVTIRNWLPKVKLHLTATITVIAHQHKITV